MFSDLIKVSFGSNNQSVNNYLKNITVEKAILVSKQLCIEFTYDEMKIVLPFVKSNWQNLLNERTKMYLLNVLTNKTSASTASKADALINKLLIIFS